MSDVVHNVSTGSFNKDNYARRQLRKMKGEVEEAVKSVEDISTIITPTLAKYKYAGNYVLQVGEYMPEAGIRASDFGVDSLEGVKGIVIAIQDICGPTALFMNKNVNITVLDADDNTLFYLNDNNVNVSFIYFNCVVSPYALAYAVMTGRAPSSSTLSETQGFYRRHNMMDNGVMFPTSTVIDDVVVKFAQNRYTQTRPIVFNMYLQY